MMMMSGMGSGGSGMNMGMDMMNQGMNMGMDMMNMGMNMGGNMGNMGNMPMAGGYMGNYPIMNHGTIDPNAAAHAGSHGTATGGGLFGSGLFDFNSLLNGLLTLAIDIFAILLLVGIVVGAAVLIKRYIFEGELFTAKARSSCVKCGQVLNTDWACCPKCGEAKVTAQTAATSAPQTA